MGATTPDGLRYPEATSTPDIPRDFKNLAEDVQRTNLKGITSFADSTERSTTIPSPSDGTTIWLRNIHQQQTWVGGTVNRWMPTGGIMPYVLIDQVPINSLPGTGTTRLASATAATVNVGGFFSIDTSTGAIIIPAPCIFNVSAQLILSYGSAAMTWTPRIMYDNAGTWYDYAQGQSTISAAGTFLVGIVAANGYMDRPVTLSTGVGHSVAGCNVNQIKWQINMTGGLY